MKNKLLLFLFLSVACGLTAQDDSLARANKVYEMFDLAKSPSFPGGDGAMMEFISSHLEYPALARESGIEGSVVVSFIVDKDGSLTDITVLKDIGGGCGKAARQVLESMPEWNPGEAEGLPVKVRYTLPLRFKLESDAPKPLSTEKEDDLGPISQEMMWILIGEYASKMNGKTKSHPSDPFNYQEAMQQRLVILLEYGHKVMTSSEDRRKMKTLGQLSNYFYQAQFAPEFFKSTDFKGRSARIPTNRADFDLNADGMGKFGSLRAPEGSKVILYSKKKFKGRKLVVDARKGALEIADMAQIPSDEPAIKNGDPGFDWGLGTQSVKVVLGGKL